MDSKDNTQRDMENKKHHLIRHFKIQEIATVFSEWKSQTDRGAAIIAAALVQDRLRDLIINRFINKDKDVNWLLKQDGPIGTFRSQISLAYANGFIDT